MPPFLSIIIPAYNEESRLPRALRQVFAFLDKQSYTSEVVVVENGSHDRTLEVAHSFSNTNPTLRILREAQAGKGRAVQRGMLEALGEYRFFADVDFSMPVEQINRFLPPECQCDIAIASREAAGASRHDEPVYRFLSGRVYNLMVRIIALPGLLDTQCGFKCFKSTAAVDIFPSVTLTGFAFDIEALAIARQRGYSIDEIGIPWDYRPGSKINVLRNSWKMFNDLWKIRQNLRSGTYARRT